MTQQFNTSMSLGRLTLNILLSFAQFERELIGERTRDKMSAARRKGKWVGGCPVLGYDFRSTSRTTTFQSFNASVVCHCLARRLTFSSRVAAGGYSVRRRSMAARAAVAGTP